MRQPLNVWFDHGGGDCVHFAHICQLYKKRGYDVHVHYEPNKDFIFKAAGLPYAPLDGCPKHGFPYLYDFNAPRPSPPWGGNKLAGNLNLAPMPKIGELPDLWDELCQVNLEGCGAALISDKARKDAWKLVGDLPRPLIFLHSHGTNMPAAKNIPNDICIELYRLLLEEGGSVLLVDWDYRVPTPPHGRIRHLKRDWGHISIEQFAALMELADLLIGVDSFPYHFATYTETPALGLFTHHYPACVTLPRARNVNMTRNADSYQPVNVARRKVWNIVEYPGTYPPAADIARHARRMLAPRRYVPSVGRDVMMQQWVDWCKGRTGSSEIADRKHTLDYLLRETFKRFKAPQIVETGCIRSPEDWAGAGNSTYLLAAQVDALGGNLTTVDIAARNCQFAKKTCQEWNGVQVVQADSVEYLRSHEGQIDVAYLDSMDVDLAGHMEHGLREFQAVEGKMSLGGIVLFDDTFYNGQWAGKGGLAVPYALSRGWQITASGYQVVLEKNSAY